MRFLMNFSTDFPRALCSRFLIMRIFLLAIFFFFGNLCCFWCLCFSFRFDLILFCFCCDDKGCYRFWVFVFLDLIWMICICFFGNTFFFFFGFRLYGFWGWHYWGFLCLWCRPVWVVFVWMMEISATFEGKLLLVSLLT